MVLFPSLRPKLSSGKATAAALSCGVFTLRPQFRRPTYRPMRLLMYSVLGASAFVPITHGVIQNGWAEQDRRMSIAYFVGLATFQFTGAVIYTARMPELWFPRTFDI